MGVAQLAPREGSGKNRLLPRCARRAFPQLHASRARGEGAADRVIFGESPSLAREIFGAARETLRDWAYLLRRPRDWAEIPSAPVRRLVQRIAHWRGARP